MASLSDRLDRVLGATAADALDEQFGMRTVDDLLRHYPRSYVEGARGWVSVTRDRKLASTSPSST